MMASALVGSTPNTVVESNDFLGGRFSQALLPTIARVLNYNITESDVDYLVNLSSLTTRQSFNATDRQMDYCGEDFKRFQSWMVDIHGVLCAIVCIFGLITNILNIIVLTRKDMVSPTNAILTGLAIADMLVMLDYLPFTIYNYLLNNQLSRCVRYSYTLSFCTLIHAHFSVICHNVSIGLTLTLAVWRYIAISYPQNNREWCSMYRAIVAIAVCYIFIPIFSLPVVLSFELKQYNPPCSTISPLMMTSSTSSISLNSFSDGRGDSSVDGSDPAFDYTGVLSSEDDPCNCTMYQIKFSDIAVENNRLLQNINFWVYSVLVKILPCIALTILSLTLIQALYRTNRRRLQLRNRNCCNTDRSCDRTTRMLLAILLLFLITEFPQGILSLLSGLLGETFYEHCVQSFNEVVDLLALINSAVNFILYCVMSKQFRQTFRHLFTPTIINNWIAIQHEITTTQATTCV